MPRSASAELIAYFAGPAQTTAYLLKVGPLPGDTYITVVSIARDFAYDDGGGERTYFARTGTQVANLSSTNDLTTDNTDAQTLQEIPTYPGQGITVEMVENGDLDGVEFVLYALNYEDPSMGHVILHAGPIGQVRDQVGGLITMELRAWADLLRQNSVCTTWGLDCRVRHFGSQPGEEREPCMYDASAELGAEVTVTAIGAESVREFTAAGLGAAEDYYAPGKWLWTAGANVGRTVEIESHTAGGDVVLRFTTRHPIEVGDKGRPKRDCTRKPFGHNSCSTYSNLPNYRGEWTMPIADAIGLTVPGAAAGGFG